ncbi:MAG: hypothetical protein JNL34_07575 [Anaerolineae bacterium]|nr:hypothetical protein [Anaerolineae bacterium]
MRYLKLVSIGLALLLGAVAVSAQDASAKPALTLERTACFGSCPIYSVTIYDDGTVVYQGERYVDVTGEQTSQIDPATVQMAVEAFADAGYFEWDESYTDMYVTDLPSVISSVTRDGETHRIERYGGDGSAPLLLPFLENWIDIMANTAQWTGAQPGITSVGMDPPVITLERTPCFGFCPTYNVAAFADGTLVYTGIANVERIGVYELHTDPLAVESVIQRAQATGYFGWQDAYDQMVITDQPTVITSLQSADQFKQITRYGGDANAPVGLLWVEDSIDQLVTDAAQ